MVGIAQFSGFFGRSLIAVAAASMLTLAPVAFQMYALSVTKLVSAGFWPERIRRHPEIYPPLRSDRCTLSPFLEILEGRFSFKMTCKDPNILPPRPQSLESATDEGPEFLPVRELLLDYQRNEFAPSLEKDWNDTPKVGQPKLAFLPPTT